jgi:hypothetical protein
LLGDGSCSGLNLFCAEQRELNREASIWHCDPRLAASQTYG